MRIDCFMFYNEVELLEARLNYLDPVVDKFLIVEAPWTLQGKPKPSFFPEKLLSQFGHKIKRVWVDRPYDFTCSYDADFYQRNAITEGLLGCEDDDYVMMSDCDEFPRADKIGHVGFFNFRFHNYYLNVRRTDVPFWYGTVAMPYSEYKTQKPQHWRDIRHTLPMLPEAGWHFTWMGDIELKYNSIALDDAQIAEGPGHLIRGKGELPDCELVPMSELPPYFSEHSEIYGRLIK